MARARLVARCIALIAVLALIAVPGRISLRAQESTPKAPEKPTARPEPTSDPAATPVPTAPAKGAGGVNRESIMRLVTGSNPMLWLLGLCSVATLGFALERVIALRRSRVIPKDFVARFHERLSGGKLDRDRAIELCKANDSAAARIFSNVVRYWGQPAATIRQAVEADAAGEIIDLKRNIRVLNATTTLAPLLGLLGTVVGMIQSFDAIGSRTGVAKGDALAQGISLALVSTAFGLGIAVVSVTMYYYLLNKVDLLVRDLDDQARKVIDLVSSEAIRPAPSDRRQGFVGEPTRHESRIH